MRMEPVARDEGGPRACRRAPGAGATPPPRRHDLFEVAPEPPPARVPMTASVQGAVGVVASDSSSGVMLNPAVTVRLGQHGGPRTGTGARAQVAVRALHSEGRDSTRRVARRRLGARRAAPTPGPGPGRRGAARGRHRCATGSPGHATLPSLFSDAGVRFPRRSGPAAGRGGQTRVETRCAETVELKGASWRDGWRSWAQRCRTAAGSTTSPRSSCTTRPRAECSPTPGCPGT